MPDRLKNKVALIAGGGTGIGRTIDVRDADRAGDFVRQHIRRSHGALAPMVQRQ